MRINNNIMALNAHRQLGINQAGASKSMEKLSSGFRINRAGDDAAGLAISEKMRGQIRGLKQAARNAQDGISLIQTAEGALNETHAILQRMRELATQSATDTNTGVDRKEIQEEINQLAAEITRIADTTEFNTQNLLGGQFRAKFHIGANSSQNVDLEINNMDANALKVAGSGEGKALVEITATTHGVAPVLDDGEHVLSVRAIDNVTIQSGETANYGLANDKGQIVAVSQDGKTYNWLDDAYSVNTLQDASTNGTATVFGEAVISGEVSVTAANGDGTLSGVTGVGSIDVSGLESGTYTYAAITTEADFNKYFGSADGLVTVGDDWDYETMAGVLLNDDGEVVAIEAIDAWTGANANEFYAIEDVDLSIDYAVGTALKADAEALMTVNLTNGDAVEVKADGGIDVSSQAAADKAITIINDALETVSAERSKLGAMQNRLEHTIANLGTSAENLQAAESRIRDLDMAEEIMAFTKNNILQQAATAMLAQANMAPQSVLQLLG